MLTLIYLEINDMRIELGHSLPTEQDSSGKVGIWASYLICGKCYSAADCDLNEWQITPKATESAIDWSIGAGYSVLKRDLVLSHIEKVIDLTSDDVTAVAMNWQLSNHKNYAAF